MTQKGNRIGGGDSRVFFFLIFVVGVLVGSSVRVTAFFMPRRSVEFFIRKLLPEGASDSE
jgi:hypothetical protein